MSFKLHLNQKTNWFIGLMIKRNHHEVNGTSWNSIESLKKKKKKKKKRVKYYILPFLLDNEFLWTITFDNIIEYMSTIGRIRGPMNCCIGESLLNINQIIVLQACEKSWCFLSVLPCKLDHQNSSPSSKYQSKFHTPTPHSPPKKLKKEESTKSYLSTQFIFP